MRMADCPASRRSDQPDNLVLFGVVEKRVQQASSLRIVVLAEC